MLTLTNFEIVFILWSSFVPLNVLSTVDNIDHGVTIHARDLTDTNIAFDLPDLIVTMETQTGTHQLEAYKSVNNDAIIRNKTTDQVSQLFWVSVGRPTFVKTPKKSNTSITAVFHGSNFGFTAYIQMLTPDQRRELASIAKTKYRLDVAENQILNLILSKFECSLTMFDEIGDKYLLVGNVHEFREFPLRMDFLARPRSIERKLFDELSSESTDLRFVCSMASRGKLMKTNTLIITTEQQQLLGIEEKLFGPATSDNSNSHVYVTRDQMTELASEMYTTLNIVEDYQMSEGQFSDAFVEGMINQIATEQFKQVPIDTVLASLSKYGFDIGQDLKPEEIKKDLGSIMTIEKIDEKSLIILDEVIYKKLTESNSRSGGFGVGVKGLEVTANWAASNLKDRTAETKSLNDQLRELNTISQKTIQWEIVDKEILPKSLNVARLARSKLLKTLSFSRIKVQTYLVSFERKFTMHDSRPAAFVDPFENLVSRISTFEAEQEKIKLSTTNIESTVKSTTQSLTSSINQLQTLGNQRQTSTDNRLQQLNTGIVAEKNVGIDLNSRLNLLSKQAVRKCRICFLESSGNTNGQCQGYRNTCSPWAAPGNVGGFTGRFYDHTDNAKGGCEYSWKIECQ